MGNDPSAANTLSVRTTHFSRNEPWVVDGLDVTARYVRVSKPGDAYIALDEIEVFAP